MRDLLRRFSICAAVALGAALSADEEAQRRLGDAAFYAGDYRNAISSYESALLLADKEGKPDAWAAGALNLGVARLHNGDVAGARRIYEEFRRRNPLRSAGTLPGDLLAAEGKYDEAEAFFKSLPADDPASADATVFSLATMYMNIGRTAEAYRLFSRLAENRTSPWMVSARNESVYALIKLGKSAEAVARIGEIPAAERNADLELLRYLAEVCSGKYDNLKADMAAFLEKMPPKPHIRLMELLAKSAEAAAAAGDPAFAAAALRQALSFSADDPVRRELHRRLIDILLDSSPASAAAEVRRYLADYPDSPDRGRVVIASAGKLYGRKLYREALELYAAAAYDARFSAADRISAAAGAVSAAEGLKDFAALDQAVRFLSAGPPSAEKLRYHERYAAFLEKNGRIKSADGELAAAFAAAADRGEKERIAMARMNFYIRSGNAAGVREMAELLKNSAEPRFAGAGLTESAGLLEKDGDLEAARKNFLKAAALPVDLAAEAAFQAARISRKMHDFTTAAAEFRAFAQKHPNDPRAPQALFMAIDAFNAVGDRRQAEAVTEFLRRNYPASDAFAALVMRDAVSRGRRGDLAGAIGELEKLEKNFSGTAIAGEAAMQKAVFMDKAGESEEALKIFSELSASRTLAAESMFHTGEILFRLNRLADAKAAFLKGAAVEPGSLLSDIASGRAGDCDLAGRSPLSRDAAVACGEKFEALAAASRFPQVRLQSFCKAGIAFERAGDGSRALGCYEKALYCAGDMAAQGIYPAPQWCIKSCESALRLIAAGAAPGALQRGLRLIDRCDGMMLPEADFTKRMRENFRRQLKQRR